MGMELDPEQMKQLIQVFRAELDEKLQSLTEGLLALEKGIVDSEYKACLDSLFRDAHNIKGAARGVDVQDVASIAHCLETLFGVLKQDKSRVNSATIDLCLQSLDHMREAMNSFELHGALPFDLVTFLAKLNAWAESVDPVQDEDPHIEHGVSPAEPLEPPTAHQETEVARVSLDKLGRVSALVEDLLAAKIEMQDHVDALQDLHKKLSEFSSSWTLEMINALSVDSQQLYKQLRATSNRVSHTSELLQDNVRLMCLVPVSTLLRPLARSVRDIAQELGKAVDYQIIGDEIEIDRPVLDGLKDSLVHLLRNAIDHGIESPTERVRQGKPEIGHICITVTALGNRINLTIQDDGAGISVKKIAATAVKKKLLSVAEAERLSMEEILDYIFRPGFSSKEMITNVSGRGVGLDVVMSSMNAMKGNVHVGTQEGKGTTFTLSLPLTLSTDRGLMVQECGAVYAIPTSVVTRVMEVSPSDLVDIQAGQAVMFEGKAIPVYALADLLELSCNRSVSPARLSVVIINKDWKNIALLVDEILGEREMVIKRLQSPLISVRNVAGGTLIGDGQIVVVLNPTDLVHTALRLSTVTRIHRDTEYQGPVEVPSILVVDDSITTRNLEKNILESQGYQVSVAVDGRQAWNALKAGNFDLVITDIEMPEMDGFELTERIKTSEEYRNIPVVIVTSHANDEDRRRGIAVNADAFIVKGEFETKALLDVVDQLL